MGFKGLETLIEVFILEKEGFLEFCSKQPSPTTLPLPHQFTEREAQKS